jgi:Transposase DDE domain
MQHGYDTIEVLRCACINPIKHYDLVAAFVTNVTQELFSVEIIGTVYRLRWEVELVFKRWKSQLEIDYLKGINENRIECLIWSRLSSILMIEIVNGHIARVALRISKDVEISHVKIIEYILRQSKFCKAMIQNRLEDFLKEMEKDIPRMLLKDKRKRKTMRERVMTFENYYGIQPSENQMVA